MDEMRFIHNIYILCKSRGIKLGDLEINIGRSPGYFSRMIKKNVNSISLIEAVKVSDCLGVNLADMVFKKFDDITILLEIENKSKEVKKIFNEINELGRQLSNNIADKLFDITNLLISGESIDDLKEEILNERI